MGLDLERRQTFVFPRKWYSSFRSSISYHTKDCQIYSGSYSVNLGSGRGLGFEFNNFGASAGESYWCEVAQRCRDLHVQLLGLSTRDSFLERAYMG